MPLASAPSAMTARCRLRNIGSAIAPSIAPPATSRATRSVPPTFCFILEVLPTPWECKTAARSACDRDFLDGDAAVGAGSPAERLPQGVDRGGHGQRDPGEVVEGDVLGLAQQLEAGG